MRTLKTSFSKPSVLIMGMMSLLPCVFYGQTNEKPMALSTIALLANPEAYHGKLVRVVGFISIEKEGTAIYFHKEDRAFSIRKNAFALHLRKEDYANAIKINGKYALVDGVFDVNTGHMGLYSGSIHSVIRVSPMGNPNRMKSRD